MHRWVGAAFLVCFLACGVHPVSLHAECALFPCMRSAPKVQEGCRPALWPCTQRSIEVLTKMPLKVVLQRCAPLLRGDGLCKGQLRQGCVGSIPTQYDRSILVLFFCNHSLVLRTSLGNVPCSRERGCLDASVLGPDWRPRLCTSPDSNMQAGSPLYV